MAPRAIRIKFAQDGRDGRVFGAREICHIAQLAAETNSPHVRPLGIRLDRRHDRSIDGTEPELETIPDEFIAPEAVSGFKRAKKRV
jgi:hypothetical protein